LQELQGSGHGLGSSHRFVPLLPIALALVVVIDSAHFREAATDGTTRTSSPSWCFRVPKNLRVLRSLPVLRASSSSIFIHRTIDNENDDDDDFRGGKPHYA
jgi:hypothetical protein